MFVCLHVFEPYICIVDSKLCPLDQLSQTALSMSNFSFVVYRSYKALNQTTCKGCIVCGESRDLVISNLLSSLTDYNSYTSHIRH